MIQLMLNEDEDLQLGLPSMTQDQPVLAHSDHQDWFQVTYPDFANTPPEKQMDILTDVIVSNCGMESTEVMLKNAGIPFNLYHDLRMDPEYAKMVHVKSNLEKVVPRLPEIYQALADGAVEGSDTKIKMILQSGGDLGPDSLSLINVQLQNKTDMELMKEMEHMQKELKQLGGGGE